jgi:hypothetical protein
MNKNKLIRLLILGQISAFLCINNFAQQKMSDKTIAAGADRYINELAPQTAFSGAVLIARNGKVILSKGYGRANLESDAPNTPQTKFRLASLTKQFTAAAIMILQERGRYRRFGLPIRFAVSRKLASRRSQTSSESHVGHHGIRQAAKRRRLFSPKSDDRCRGARPRANVYARL